MKCTMKKIVTELNLPIGQNSRLNTTEEKTILLEDRNEQKLIKLKQQDRGKIFKKKKKR